MSRSKCGLFKTYFRRLGFGAIPRKHCYFYSNLSLKSIPSSLTQNCYKNMKISFSWELLNLNWVPLSPTSIPYLKDYPDNIFYIYVKSRRLQKSQFLDSLMSFEELRSLFPWLEKKVRSPTTATFKNQKKTLWIGEKLEVQPKATSLNISIFNLWINWESLSPNFSFIIKNENVNLHKIRLFTFQI